MSGIYIHIPFCKQACHYCDFHFSTSVKKKEEMVVALARELRMRREETGTESVETIYFGGGTPSLLTLAEIEFLIATIYKEYHVSDMPEITLEANPDDLAVPSPGMKMKTLYGDYLTLGINRLSIGIQSFFDDDLQWMNRAHQAKQSIRCLETARAYFDNISVDLIYGIPGSNDEKWTQNIDQALSFSVPHISSYALTVEPKTALQSFIVSGKYTAPDEEAAQRQFTLLVDKLRQAGFIHYELSNFGKEGYFSRNNSAYWQGKNYVGIGPSAHSYDGLSRSWNVSNNSLYLKAIAEGQRPSRQEILTQTDRYNEYVMTGLRTMWGLDLNYIKETFGSTTFDYLRKHAQKYCDDGLLVIENEVLKTTDRGKFLTDGISSDLFLIHLK